jgi:hypothetical protein
LGSVEAFPRKAGTLADVWRLAPTRASGVPRLRAARLEDYAAIRALQRTAQPHRPPWSLRQFESHLQAFARGQLVVECNGELLGAASSLVAAWDEGALDRGWAHVTGDGHFTTHDPAGHTLYVADSCVDLSRRGPGIARPLHLAQRKLCRALNLRRIVTAGRLAGYRAVHHAMTPEAYARRVGLGDIDDPLLRFAMMQGFQLCGVVRDFFPGDVESCRHAAVLAWLNPLYSPAGPPAFEVTARPRKCA